MILAPTEPNAKSKSSVLGLSTHANFGLSTAGPMAALEFSLAHNQSQVLLLPRKVANSALSKVRKVESGNYL